MRELIAVEHVTLDGVVQAPGHPDEDRRGGFEHGGWHAAYVDEEFARIAGQRIAATDAYLFGRWTYEKMARFWADVPEGDIFGDTLNRTTKHVVSSTLDEPLTWRNSSLLQGEAPQAVKELKAQPGGTICLLGSGQLLRTLLEHGLVDRLLLTIDPIVLGSGTRLFEAGHGPCALELEETLGTSNGVIVASYRS
jgi:dihydrofolate reductase